MDLLNHCSSIWWRNTISRKPIWRRSRTSGRASHERKSSLGQYRRLLTADRPAGVSGRSGTGDAEVAHTPRAAAVLASASRRVPGLAVGAALATGSCERRNTGERGNHGGGGDDVGRVIRIA